MDFMKLCAERYSVRSYLPDPVSAELLDEILRAGVAAGTAAVTRKSGVSFSKEKYEAIYGELQVKEIF